MKEIFEKHLSLFYENKDKAKIGRMMMEELGIKRDDFLNFKSLGKMIGRKITESEKDKLHMLYNSIDDKNAKSGSKIILSDYVQHCLLVERIHEIELFPERIEYLNMGNAYYEKGNYDKAIECYIKAIELKPDYALAYNNMGNVYYEKNDYEKAIECFKKAIELDPDDALLYFNMGNTFYEKNNYEKAIECYKKTIELKLYDAKVYNNMGDAYYNKGNYDEAIKCYAKVIDLNPNDIDTYNDMGNAFKALGNQVKANECYERAKMIRNK